MAKDKVIGSVAIARPDAIGGFVELSCIACSDVGKRFYGDLGMNWAELVVDTDCGGSPFLFSVQRDAKKADIEKALANITVNCQGSYLDGWVPDKWDLNKLFGHDGPSKNLVKHIQKLLKQLPACKRKHAGYCEALDG